MSEVLSGSIWFIPVVLGPILLGIAIFYASKRRRVRGGDPNNAWRDLSRENPSSDPASKEARR
jgi:hypothetical protein